jgi:hypothetical protein
MIFLSKRNTLDKTIESGKIIKISSYFHKNSKEYIVNKYENK